MAKNKSDTIKIIEAIDTLVIPKLENIEKKLGQHDKKFEKLDDDSEYLKDSVTRIELKLDNEVKRNDEQSIKIEKVNTRVLKLEKSEA